jgi:hypothetical protein
MPFEVIISNSRELIFVHIHRTGGTSIERALDPFMRWNDVLLGGSEYGERIQTDYRERFGLWKHSSFSDIRRVCGDELLNAYRSFSLVRHPVSRFLSLYRFSAKIAGRVSAEIDCPVEELRRRARSPEGLPDHPWLTWTNVRSYLATSTFLEFLTHPVMPGDLTTQTQVSRLSLDGRTVAVKRVFQLETLPEHIEELRAYCRCDLALRHDHAAEPVPVSPEDLMAGAEFIRSSHRADFETFGYKETWPPQG